MSNVYRLAGIVGAMAYAQVAFAPAPSDSKPAVPPRKAGTSPPLSVTHKNAGLTPREREWREKERRLNRLALGVEV
jgi:hypothetical protein